MKLTFSKFTYKLHMIKIYESIDITIGIYLLHEYLLKILIIIYYTRISI